MRVQHLAHSSASRAPINSLDTHQVCTRVIFVLDERRANRLVATGAGECLLRSKNPSRQRILDSFGVPAAEGRAARPGSGPGGKVTRELHQGRATHSPYLLAKAIRKTIDQSLQPMQSEVRFEFD